VIVLAAGQGTRMKSPLAKVLHPVGGRPILGAVLDAADGLRPDRTIVVVGSGQDAVARYAEARGARALVQDPPRGTGDAARAALPGLKDFRGDVLVLFGDSPLMTSATLARVLAGKGDAAMAVMGFRPADPAPYGRLVTGDGGTLSAIVEARDATDEEKRIGYCNGGGLVVDADLLAELVGELTPHNAQGEFYLTGIVKGANRRNRRVIAIEVPADDVVGINSQSELAEAEAIFQRRARVAHMAAGVTLADPETVYFSADTRIGAGTSIGQNVVFGPGVRIADGAIIRPFCHLEGVSIASGAQIGPFARLRPGSEIGENVHIGNFVETKEAKIASGAKANHLTYLGDVTIGADANIGAGTITCNYDGFFKYRTEIGAGAFIGSNTSLVAPVKIGENANIGAGSVITREVDADALAIERAQQVERPGWAARFRAMMRAKKEKRD
jgi:bifunctional UDP-N-acetylglucosamine pyrophosphorylase/glucosamine-1-phosphate N-acetyltransferase